MNKKQKKEQYQKSWGLKVDGNTPVILVSDVDEHIQMILQQIIDGIAAIGLQMVFVEPKDEKILQQCREWNKKYPLSISLISEDAAREDIFDIALLEDVTQDKLLELRDHMRVPVAEKGIVPFDPIQEQGNGFVFEGNAWSLFAALVRAAETYRFPYDWNNILKAVRKSLPAS